MPRRKDDTIIPIVDATVKINRTVNLFGVVMESSIRRKSKGTDYYCTLRIVDESMPRGGFSVNFFTATMEELPRLQCAGDIIKLSRVLVKIHETNVYAQFHKNFSKFALFDGKSGSSTVPYQSSYEYDRTDQDDNSIVGLRDWMVRDMNNIVCSNLELMSNIVQGEFNMVCKILHWTNLPNNNWILFVWDGTDTPPMTIDNKAGDEVGQPIPLQLEPFQLPRDILCSFPFIGTVLRVKLGPTEMHGLDTDIKTGKWVKLINLKCKVKDGLWSGSIKHFSKFCYLPDDHNLIEERLRNYDERIHMGSARFPLTSELTVTEYPDAPFVSLMRVLTYPEVTAKFKCVVRVLDVLPWLTEEFLSPDGIYRIRLTLEDSTARINAFLSYDDAIKFFDGYHPTDVLTRKINLLLGMDESSNNKRDPPWVQVCLKSYYVEKQNPWDSRNYCLFATRFKG